MTRTEATNAAKKWTPWVAIGLTIAISGASVVSMFAELRSEQRATNNAIADLKSRLERMEGLYFLPPARPGAAGDRGTR